MTLKELQVEVDGPRSERSRCPAVLPLVADAPTSTHGATRLTESPADRRPRGHQLGAPGHGRYRQSNLPEVVVDHEVPTTERRCAQCGVSAYQLGIQA
ncbi:MAG: hypothetical protein C7B45_03680 [Sulfobacillus acidophilus]|uniref:Uncharacterized protein n=1 Tax=Sulfobacillus acidophilus TaxID=53633 RepID=A0A2T2WLU7_9FIRM|nr:MAG: hypothetical protein C7B45_03680 [Sulfobacillus acidophilus]